MGSVRLLLKLMRGDKIIMVNKAKKTRFNLIDFIIILFVAMAAVGIFLRFNLADEINFNATGDIFEIEFVTAGHIQEASQDYFITGEKFYIHIESLEIGEITEILDIRNPAEVYVLDLNGNISKSEQPGRIDVRGVMRSRGRMNKDGEYMINGNINVASNKEFFVHTGKWEGTIKIISVTKAN